MLGSQPDHSGHRATSAAGAPGERFEAKCRDGMRRGFKLLTQASQLKLERKTK
jgi:hypothetical protein